MLVISRKSQLAEDRANYSVYSMPLLDPTLKCWLGHGWMFQDIYLLDNLYFGRWEHWRSQIEFDGDELTDTPQIEFVDTVQTSGLAMLKVCLYQINSHKPEITVRALEYFLDWILYGLGDRLVPELPVEPPGCEGASNRLYQLFDPRFLMVNPRDSFGDLLLQCHLTESDFLSHETAREWVESEGSFTELGTYLIDDKECATGRILLEMSNFYDSVCGITNNLIYAKCSLINSYLFAPWIAKPYQYHGRESIFLNDFNTRISSMATDMVVKRVDRLITYKRNQLRSFIDYDGWQLLIIAGGYLDG